MRHALYILFAFLTIYGLSGCGHLRSDADPETALKSAEKALAKGDYDTARECCDVLTDSTQMTVGQLCREALVYAKLAEKCETPEDMNQAVKCFTRAYEAYPDSVHLYMENADVDSRSSLSLLSELFHTIENPASTRPSLDEMMDSMAPDLNIPVEEITINEP